MAPVRRPEELAGVAIGVGYHSGSHFATVQADQAVSVSVAPVSLGSCGVGWA
jgi:hypothetical protein